MVTFASELRGIEPRGPESPILLSVINMIEKGNIETLVNEIIKETKIFLVTVKVSSSNRITILADTREGITIDECALIHRQVEKNLNRDVEDFELQVSSPGLDMPFVVIEQYYKNEGRKVEVIGDDGARYTGNLKNITDGGFELETEVKVKGKMKETKDISFNFDQVKSTRVILTIK
jgi:ribosome maturation factor RimP